MSQKLPDEETTMLDQVSPGYTAPDPGRVVDRKILCMIVDAILPWVRGPDVIEMGYGDAAWTGAILQRFGHSAIVDAAEPLLERARADHGDKIQTFHSLFEDFEPDVAFDTVLASYVLEHVRNPIEILKKAASWLKPGGCVIVIVPNAGSLHRRLGVAMGAAQSLDELGETDRKIGHRRVYTVESMESDIKASGLEVMDRKGLFAKFLPQSLMVDFSDELLAGCMKLGDELPMDKTCALAFRAAANEAEAR